MHFYVGVHWPPLDCWPHLAKNPATPLFRKGEPCTLYYRNLNCDFVLIIISDIYRPSCKLLVQEEPGRSSGTHLIGTLLVKYAA
jgi:hypothetical protein